jgi:wobble nucleotide-excising tRNase
MIESITLRSVASYDHIGVTIDDLKEINFIYGSNGTGKTTISNLLHDPENFDDCNVKWKNGSPVNTLVYNKAFRERNFGKGEIDGVFTLGEATKDDLEKIRDKEKELKKVQDELNHKNEKINELTEHLENENDSFQENVWIRFYKKYENEFDKAYVGYKKKYLFKGKLIDDCQNNSSPLLSHEALIEKAKTIFGDQPVRLDSLQTINYRRIVEILNESIWASKIVGKADVDIASLIQRLNLNDWVNEGRGYLEDTDTCPFCQQKTISDSFRQQLEVYFDETYSYSLKLIKSLGDEYQLLVGNLVNSLKGIENAEKSNANSKLDIAQLSTYLATLNSQIATNRELLAAKTKEPSRSIQLVMLDENFSNIDKLFKVANADILKHNQIVQNFAAEHATLVNAVWRFIAEEAKTTVAPHLAKVNGLDKAIQKTMEQKAAFREQERLLKLEIVQLNQNVTSVQPTIDEMNRQLASYGFTNFEITPSPSAPNKYQIARDNGDQAEATLSEGEVTFITFLYFLQLAKGGKTEEAVGEERVLVIDDPISSLDSNILFVVSSLIKGIIQDIRDSKGNVRQLFLLTHNVYFHKEVSFIDSRTKELRTTHYWILRKRDKVTSVQSFGQKNPISSSYELLWRELKEREHTSGVGIQNTMRRILENYFKILGKYGDDTLVQQFESTEEKMICRSLISWINDGSHSLSDDLFIEMQDDTVERYLVIFRQVFARTNHLAHYNMMMGIVDEEPLTEGEVA